MRNWHAVNAQFRKAGSFRNRREAVDAETAEQEIEDAVCAVSERDHECVSKRTKDGYGAYCTICGDTLE